VKNPRLLSKVIGLSLSAGALLAPQGAWALDSYRYLHVTIETPWFIFLFLLPLVLSPFILLVVLYWRFSFRRQDKGKDAESNHVGGSSEIK